MFVGHQKYGDEGKLDTMLRYVMRGMPVPTTENPLPIRFTSSLPTVPRPLVRLYIRLLSMSDLYILSYYLALQIIDGPSNRPLGT